MKTKNNKKLNIKEIRRKYFRLYDVLDECYRYYGDIYEGDDSKDKVKECEKRFAQRYYCINNKYGLNDCECAKILEKREIVNRMKKKIKANYCTSNKKRYSNNDDFDLPF